MNEIMLVLCIMLGVVAVCAVAIWCSVEPPKPFRGRENSAAHGADAWAAEELRRGRL